MQVTTYHPAALGTVITLKNATDLERFLALPGDLGSRMEDAAGIDHDYRAHAPKPESRDPQTQACIDNMKAAQSRRMAAIAATRPLRSAHT